MANSFHRVCSRAHNRSSRGHEETRKSTQTLKNHTHNQIIMSEKKTPPSFVEGWERIPGASGFEINTDAVVRNFATKKVVKPQSNGTVSLYGDDKKLKPFVPNEIADRLFINRIGVAAQDRDDLSAVEDLLEAEANERVGVLDEDDESVEMKIHNAPQIVEVLQRPNNNNQSKNNSMKKKSTKKSNKATPSKKAKLKAKKQKPAKKPSASATNATKKNSKGKKVELPIQVVEVKGEIKTIVEAKMSEAAKIFLLSTHGLSCEQITSILKNKKKTTAWYLSEIKRNTDRFPKSKQTEILKKFKESSK